MVVPDGNGLPLAVLLDSAQKAAITLAEETLGLVWVPKDGPGHPKTKPKELVADRGYDRQAFRMYLRRSPGLAGSLTSQAIGCAGSWREPWLGWATSEDS
jgi:hypothetical protein